MASEENVDDIRNEILHGIQGAISAARNQEGGFFPCNISDSSLLSTSGSVMPLSGPDASRDPGEMCDAIIEDLDVDPQLL